MYNENVLFSFAGDIVGSGVGGSLATMPFQVLESLLEATPLTTDDGLLLRRMCLESGALHLILACLAALSHQDTPEVVSSLYHQVSGIPVVNNYCILSFVK